MDAFADSKVESIPFLRNEIPQRTDPFHGSHLLTKRHRGRSTRRSTRTTDSSWSRAAWWGFLVLLLLSNAGLILERYKYPQHTHDCAGDSTGYAPWFPQEVKSFTDDFRYTTDHFNPPHKSEKTAKARAAWQSLFPPGEGLIRIDDQQDVEKYGLPPTRAPRYPINSTIDALETSMGHELHCLWEIQRHFGMAIRGEHIKSFEHVDHCVNFIAQAIVCAGDLALEGYAPAGSPPLPPTLHVCKKYDAVMDWFGDLKVVEPEDAWANSDPLED
ncbi:uncharacterized protein RAG0_14716 [Rhynchosporium agropyri]|uniref:Oxidase ustYa n=1 Tax=Rhynchosporium agropyri TaxID=914238 RepID=A0A1E1LI56_9HELO|nr:uncharacterized protein RAG0_14716 [Rhynchosporium agropyri]